MLNTKTNQWWSGEGIWVEALGPSVCPTIPSGSVRCLEDLLTRRPVLLSLPSTIVDKVRVGEAGGRRRGLGTSPSLCIRYVCVCDRPLVRVEGDFQAAGAHFGSVWRPDDLGGSVSFRFQSQREAGEMPPNPQWLWPRSWRKAQHLPRERLWSPGSSEPGSLPCTQPSAHCAPLPLHNPACPSAACCTQTRASPGFPSPLPGALISILPAVLFRLQVELGSPCPSRPLSKCSPPPTQLWIWRR